MIEEETYTTINSFIEAVDKVCSSPSVSRKKLVVHKCLLFHKKKPRWYLFWPRFFRVKWMKKRNAIPDGVRSFAKYYDMEIMVSESLKDVTGDYP